MLEKEGYWWFYSGKSSILNTTDYHRKNEKSTQEETFLFKLFGAEVSLRKTEMFLRRVN